MDFPTVETLEEAERHLHNLQAQYESYGTLRTALQAYTDAAQRYTALQDALAALETAHAAAQARQTALAETLATMDATYAAQKAEADAAHAQVLAQLADEEQAARALVSWAQAELAQARETLQAEQQTARQRVQMAAEHERGQLERDLDALRVSRQQLMAEVQSLQLQRDTLRREMAALVERVVAHG